LDRGDGTVEVRVHGEPGGNYGLETSSNLVDWAEWTNGVAAEGTWSEVDPVADDLPFRYYRAVRLP
jgi:hypothetical protein